MAKVTLLTLGYLLLLSFVAGSNYKKNIPENDYFKTRSNVLVEDQAKYLGSDLSLTVREEIANQHLMELKRQELDSYHSSNSFPLANLFMGAKDDIDASEVFKFIQKESIQE